MEEHEEAETYMGDKLSLHIVVDPTERNERHSVTWYGLCGYSSVELHCTDAQEARQLFKALQTVCGYEAD